MVSIQLSNSGEYVLIPVLYTIENENNNENIKLINCKVNLDDKKIPEWLSPSEFVIRQIYNPGYAGVGVTVTELSSIHCKNTDSAVFVDRVHESIRLNEKMA